MKIVTLVNNSMEHDVRVRRHAATLAEAGHDVTLIGVLTGGVLHPPQLPEIERLTYRWADRRRASGVRGSASWLASSLATRAARRAIRAGLRSITLARRAVATSYQPLLAEALRHDADLYYANDIDTLPVGVEAARRRGRPLIYDAHEFYLEQMANMPPEQRTARRLVEAEGLSASAASITVSDLIAKEMVAEYGCPPQHIVRNIPDWSENLAVEEAPPPDQPVRVLYHSSHLALHGRRLKDLIDAVALLNGAVRLTLRGRVEGARREELRAYLQTHLPADTWRLEPAVPFDAMMRDAAQHDIGAIVLNADQVRSEYLTIPNKLFEYMAAGLAVVAQDTPAVSEIITREQVGFVAARGCPAELAEGLRRLAANREELTAIKGRARRAAEETYNWKTERRVLLDVVKNLVPANVDPANLGSAAQRPLVNASS